MASLLSLVRRSQGVEAPLLHGGKFNEVRSHRVPVSSKAELSSNIASPDSVNVDGTSLGRFKKTGGKCDMP